MFMIRLRIFLLFDQFYLLIHRWLKVEVYRLNEKEGRSPRSIRIIYILDFHFSFHSLLFLVPSWFRTIHTLFPHTHTHTHTLFIETAPYILARNSLKEIHFSFHEDWRSVQVNESLRFAFASLACPSTLTSYLYTRASCLYARSCASAYLSRKDRYSIDLRMFTHWRVR